MRRPHAQIALALGFTAVAASIVAGQLQNHAEAAAAPAPIIRTLAAALPTPKLSALVVPSTLTTQQGHARFLVGVRTSIAAHIVIHVTNISTKKEMNAITETALHKAGRVFMLVQATDSSGYQLPPGAYSIFVGAKAADGHNAKALTATMHLVYTTPRGVFDWFTVPVNSDIRASVKLHTSSGELVAAVAPGGWVAKAGIERGDVIETINGISVQAPGGLATALRVLLTGTSVPVVLLRGTTTLTKTLTTPPDWTSLSSLSAPMAAAARTKLFGYSYAEVAYDISTGNTAAAAKIIPTWSKADGATALAQLAHAQLHAAADQQAASLPYWTKALAINPTLSTAAFGEGLALDATGNDPAAANAFAHAAALDRANSSAPAYEALAEEQAKLPYLALTPARTAVAIDSSDPNALAAEGIAWMKTGSVATGIKTLEHALLLTDDLGRAQLLITAYLEPAAR